MILSIDVGTRNLALVGCSIEEKQLVVEHASLVDLGVGSVSDCSTRAVEVLSALGEKHAIERVLIEQQNSRNQRAFGLAHVLLGVFMHGGVDARFVSPVNKFKLFVELGLVDKSACGRHNKAKRKRLAVRLTALACSRLAIDFDLSRFKKKDDLSDAFIYCLNELSDEVDLRRLDERRALYISLNK